MDISAITNLGVAGFAIYVMWKKDQARDKQIDERDTAFRNLEKEVRTEITTQLIASTSTNVAAQKVMERVLDKLGK